MDEFEIMGEGLCHKCGQDLIENEIGYMTCTCGFIC